MTTSTSAPRTSPVDTIPAAPRVGARRPALLLVLLWIAVVLVPLPVREVMPPDEARFAHQAQNMKESGDWIVPRIGDVVNTDKPPMLFWLANVFSVGRARVGETASRLPSAFAALAAALLTWRLGRRLWGSDAIGLAGAAVLLTGSDFASRAGWCSCDMLLAGFSIAALTCWREALFEAPTPRARRWLLAAGWLCAAGGTLSKGPLGLLWPFAWVLVEALVRRRARALAGLLRPEGPALFVLAVGGWLAAFAAETGSGFGIYDLVFRQNVTRYASPWNNFHPWYFYAYQAPLDWMPWTLFVPAVLWCAWRDLSAERDAARRVPLVASLVFVGASVVFFSISPGKRGVYLLPMYFAVALVTASAFARPRERQPGRAWFRAPIALLALLGVVVGLVLPWLAASGRLSAAARLTDRIGSGWIVTLAVLGLVLACGAVVAWIVARRRGPRGALVPLVLTTAAFLLVLGTLGGREWTRYQNGEPFGARVAAIVPEGQRIAVERGKFELVLYYAHRHGTECENDDQLAQELARGTRYAVLSVPTYDRLSRAPMLAGLVERDRAPLGSAEYVVLGPPRS